MLAGRVIAHDGRWCARPGVNDDLGGLRGLGAIPQIGGITITVSAIERCRQRGGNRGHGEIRRRAGTNCPTARDIGCAKAEKPSSGQSTRRAVDPVRPTRSVSGRCATSARSRRATSPCVLASRHEERSGNAEVGDGCAPEGRRLSRRPRRSERRQRHSKHRPPERYGLDPVWWTPSLRKMGVER